MAEKNYQSINSFLSSHLKEYFTLHEDIMLSSGLYELIISEVEKALISETMLYTEGVQAKAAQILGISRNTLRKKIHQLQ